MNREKIKRNKNKEMYLWYVNFLFDNGRSPKMSEAGEHFGISRERARQIFDRLTEEGYLVRINKNNNSGKNYALIDWIT